jgi:hypothetical protein
VEPLSVKHRYKGKFSNDLSQLKLLTVPVGPDLPPQPVEWTGAPLEVLFTYDAKWEPSDIKWASRWDLYLYMGVCTPTPTSRGARGSAWQPAVTAADVWFGIRR